MSLPEFERENIIATRQEQMHERETRKQVAKMAARTGGPSGGADSDEGEEDEDDGALDFRTEPRSCFGRN